MIGSPSLPTITDGVGRLLGRAVGLLGHGGQDHIQNSSPSDYGGEEGAGRVRPQSMTSETNAGHSGAFLGRSSRFAHLRSVNL
jgi:hypothetical protein